jgi:hypothetical protein
MLYAANLLDLDADVEQLCSKFAAGLRSAAERNFRPHLLYGHRESQTPGGGFPPLQLPPLQNSFAITHGLSSGSITTAKERQRQNDQQYGQGKKTATSGAILQLG